MNKKYRFDGLRNCSNRFMGKKFRMVYFVVLILFLIVSWSGKFNMS